MKRIRPGQIIVLTITVMAIALAPSRAHAAPTPPGPDVRVVNTQTNPVPVSVINFPTGTNTVNVSSSTNAPLIVRSLDNPAQQPFHLSQAFQVAPGSTRGYGSVVYVPEGKRLVVEYISFMSRLPKGQTVIQMHLATSSTSSGGENLLIAIPHLVGDYPDDPTPTSFFLASQLVKGYVNPGGFLSGQFQRDGTNDIAKAEMYVTGYLVDVP